MPRKPAPVLSHLDSRGRLRMVDVSAKAATHRSATASARVTTRPEVLRTLLGPGPAKGDALSAARVAGIMAAKRTGEWIPLCHPLPLDWVGIDFEPEGKDTLLITATARTRAPTGVEMEALIAVSAAALTIYDMAKAADKAMTIGPIQLEAKTGGKSGTYRRTKNRKVEKSKSRNGGR